VSSSFFLLSFFSYPSSHTLLLISFFLLRLILCALSFTDRAGHMKSKLTISCLSGNGSKDVAEVLLTLKKKEWADKLDWQVAQ
jgi:hypothetical protein